MKPRVGDGIWTEGLAQPNGKIVSIDWQGDKEVLVQCYDTGELVTLEWDELSHFNERLNQWIINRG